MSGLVYGKEIKTNETKHHRFLIWQREKKPIPRTTWTATSTSVFFLKGKRIRLISTKDLYTKLKKGDTGTIQFRFVNSDRIAIVTKWDSGSDLSMIEGVDSFEIFEDEFTP